MDYSLVVGRNWRLVNGVDNIPLDANNLPKGVKLASLRINVRQE